MQAVTASINDRLRRWPDWPLYVIGVVPIVTIYYQGITGQLGVDPAKVIEHKIGLWALWLLIAGLAISPISKFFGLRMIKFRRAIGLLGFFYVLVHMLTWLVLDVQILSQVWADILKRPYITIGMLAFVLMIPLAATSNNWSIRKMGAQNWQRLHRLTYAVALLGALHFVMLAKGFQLEPLIYLAVVLGLVGLRFAPRKSRRRAA
jgi:sulfoxide reductase heme-binding subunit YedZ